MHGLVFRGSLGMRGLAQGFTSAAVPLEKPKSGVIESETVQVCMSVQDFEPQYKILYTHTYRLIALHQTSKSVAA